MLCSNLQYNFNKNRSNPTFGTIERTVRNFSDGSIKYRNNSYMFRPDVDWDILVSHIDKENPNRIYCYACSDGSEPYTLALKLIKKLGWQEAQKHFPIIAKDIDCEVINKAKQSELYLSSNDIQGIKKLGFPFKRLFHNEHKKDGNIFRVDKKLSKCIDFSLGDIVDDAKKLDFENSTILFRNAFPYLGPQKFKSLFLTLKEKFKPTSTLVVGQYDCGGIPLLEYILSFADLEEVQPYIFKKVARGNEKTAEETKKILQNVCEVLSKLKRK